MVKSKEYESVGYHRGSSAYCRMFSIPENSKRLNAVLAIG